MTVARRLWRAHHRPVASFSLYFHIPYCGSKCPYCDFNSHAVKHRPERAYVDALVAEMTACAAEPPWRNGEIRTVFFGGGTPSLFAPASIGAVLAAAFRIWSCAEGAVEVTLEANPGTVDMEKLRGFGAAGVNRMSFGVQSFQPRHLKRLGRIHGAAEARAAVDMARAAGFGNVGLDLMFAIPGQTLDEWEADLAAAMALAPDHISAYNLTYEEGTPFAAWRGRGALAPVTEEVEAAMFIRAQDLLAAFGYAQYEISNYALPGRECAHNLNYWRGGAYLGIGAGAHSFVPVRSGGRRWSNEMSPSAYVERIKGGGHARVDEELLTPEQGRGEFAFLGLRCRDGIDEGEFARRFGVEFTAAFPQAVGLARDGALERTAGRWRLSPRGLMVADSIFACFL